MTNRKWTNRPGWPGIFCKHRAYLWRLNWACLNRGQWRWYLSRNSRSGPPRNWQVVKLISDIVGDKDSPPFEWAEEFLCSPDLSSPKFGWKEDKEL